MVTAWRADTSDSPSHSPTTSDSGCERLRLATISGWLPAAARRKLRLAYGRRLLAEYEAEHGPITPEEEAAVAAKIAEAERIASEEYHERARRPA